MRLYIAGPMRGLPNYNFARFDECRDYLRSLGHRVISPADHDRAMGYVTDRGGVIHTTAAFNIHAVLRWDLAQVATADGIVLLPGWEDSTGAAHERYVAEACGLKVFTFLPGHSLRAPALTEEVPPVIIGVSGYAQAGKDTIGGYLREYGFERLAFADALKAVLADLDPVLAAEVSPPGAWEKAKPMLWFGGNTVRDGLQRLGASVRKHVDKDAWLNAALRQTKPGGKYVVTDVRFPNEAQAIERMGGQVWRVERPGTKPINGHPSEVALDEWVFSATISNTGTLDDLRDAVGRTLIHPDLHVAGCSNMVDDA